MWAIPSAAILILAGLEVRSRGSDLSSSLSVADYRAQAEADGSIAPEFVLPLLDGNDPVSLSSLRGSVVVLNVWASWCTPCREEAPDLEAAWKAYRDRGVAFLGVNERDNKAAAQSFVREVGITYPSVFDPDGRIAFLYGFVGLPTTYVIDAEGRIVYRFTGYLQGSILRDSLDEVLLDRNPL